MLQLVTVPSRRPVTATARCGWKATDHASLPMLVRETRRGVLGTARSNNDRVPSELADASSRPSPLTARLWTFAASMSGGSGAPQRCNGEGSRHAS
jgi:hypothetical protein